MPMPDAAYGHTDDPARNDAAAHLRLIAKDIRGWGDIPLVRLSEDGVTRDPLTLADELELVAIQLAGVVRQDGSTTP